MKFLRENRLFMVQLIQSQPGGDELGLPLDPESHLEQLPLPFPQKFDETDLPESLDHGRVILFVDGANLFYSASHLGMEIDYAKLLEFFRDRHSTLLYAFFYTGVDPANARQQAFLTWMRRNGFRVITKDVVLQSTGTKRAGSMNVEIAVDMMRWAQSCDTAILLSGDGDLAYAASAVSYMGVRVEVFALRSMTHDALIRVADRYTDLAEIRDAIQKPPRQSQS
jgi:uncharacterized LabA/DUF88 family protein